MAEFQEWIDWTGEQIGWICFVNGQEHYGYTQEDAIRKAGLKEVEQ